LLTVLHLSIFISVINKLDAQNFCFTIRGMKFIVKQKFCASSWLITEITKITVFHVLLLTVHPGTALGK